MQSQTFPPSPNWYLNDILCARRNGQVIYGSRNAIVILTFDEKFSENTSFPKVQTIDYAHKERITCVRVCPDVTNKLSNCFATCGDDSLVKLWDMNTMTPVIANFAHGEEKKVIGMDWSSHDPGIIVSFDDHGGVIVWDIEKNTTFKINLTKLLQTKKNTAVKVNFGKIIPNVIKFCPHQKDRVAIGMKGGLVCIISIKDSGKVLYTMRGHDKDVTSLAWCPVPENVLDSANEKSQAFILASVCRDRIIHFWRGIDGQFQRTVKLPNTYLGRHTRLTANSCMLSLDWPCKTILVSSSNYGEVLRYDLSPEEQNTDGGGQGKVTEQSRSKGQWRLIHDLHPRGVFVVHAVNMTKAEEIDDESKGVVIWSTAQDRNLVAVYMDNGRILANIPTIGGFVYCMASSPFDPSRVAVGLGDYSIRIWNTGNVKEVQMGTLWQKIKGKVMAIAWHPVQEMKLAFGTHEGRVGIQDLIPGHLPILLVPRHRHTVYALSWGPPCYKEGEECHLPQFCLYSCGDGEILMYNTDNPDQEPMRMNSFIRVGADNKKKENTCTDIAWKPDYTLLAVGNNDGSVQLFSSPHLKLIYTLYAHRKLLMTLTWHPLSTSSDSNLSTMRHFIATGSNENVIQVFDLSTLVDAVSTKEEFSGSIQPIATLNGHQKKVVRLSWSPHTSGHLCSASYDDTVRVWDVIHQTCIGCFTGHIGACLACMWSPMDPDIIISGSSDFTIRVWRISEAKDIPKSIQKSSQKKKAAPIASASSESTVKNDEASEVPAVPVAKSAEGEKKPTGHTWRGSLFPVSWKIAGGIGKVDGIRLILDKEKGSLGNLDEPSIAKLGFYGNREDMQFLLKKEEAYHLAHENLEQAQLMSLWQGNVAEMLKDAISKGKLSDWLVSLAPSASHKLWMEACQAYSEQLANSGKYNQAAAYLLACHKVDEAIELLRSQSLFREALAIARCRLAPDDPTAYQLTLDWGHNLLMKGNYEIAAMCFTSIGEYLDAAKAIASRSTMPECVALGATLALKSGPQGRELGMILTLQCMHLYLSDNDWHSALECIKPLEILKPLSIVIQLHRRLVEGFQALDEEGKSDLLQKWLEAGEDKMAEEKTPTSILHLSPLPFGNDSNITADEAYSCISSRRADKVCNSQKNFLVELGEELALAVCAASLEGENKDRRWHHILKSMRLCYSNQVLDTKESSQHALFILCFLLCPFGPKTIDILFDSSHCDTNKGFAQSLRAFYAYGAAIWAEDKWSMEISDKPWNLLTNILLSYLPDVLDPIAASYYKEEVEIHKREQEIAKQKALLRLHHITGSTKTKKKQDIGKSEEISAAEDNISVHSNEMCIVEGQDVVESEDTAHDSKETIAAESVEDALKEKESALIKLKEKREYFEKNRISAPNPYLCLFKLRIVSEIAVTASENQEEFFSKDVLEFHEKVSMAKIDSS